MDEFFSCYLKFSDLGGLAQKYISKKFPKIKGTDLIYLEHCKNCPQTFDEMIFSTYIVKEIAPEGVDIICIADRSVQYIGMDNYERKILSEAPKDFTIMDV